MALRKTKNLEDRGTLEILKVWEGFWGGILRFSPFFKL